MSRAYAQFATSMWRPENDWNDLNDYAQRMYQLLSGQEDISAAGVLTLAVDRWAGNARNTTPETVWLAIKELVDTRYVVVDERTCEILVRTFVKADRGYNNEKRRPVIVKAAMEVRSPALRRVLAEELTKLGIFIEGLASPTQATCDGLSAAGGHLAVADRTESTYQQVDSPSDRQVHGPPTSEGVVVTKAVPVGAPSPNPQPPTRDDLRAVADSIRTIRRDWSVTTVENAIRTALAAGHTMAQIAAAFAVVADDTNTRSPGRLNAPGPWWDSATTPTRAAPLLAEQHVFAEDPAHPDTCRRCGTPRRNRHHLPEGTLP